MKLNTNKTLRHLYTAEVSEAEYGIALGKIMPSRGNTEICLKHLSKGKTPQRSCGKVGRQAFGRVGVLYSQFKEISVIK
jgi:hypothetical protein